jgi:hypothetical protein
MASDQGSRRPDPKRPDFQLPELVDVRIRLVPYNPPRHRNFESELPAREQAVELVVTTDRPIPIRALGPVLYVGRAVVTESEPLEENVYRFLALDPETLEEGRPITLAWSGEPPPRRPRSNLTFELPQG